MAIGKDAAAIFETMAAREQSMGSLLMLGRQSMALQPSEIRNLRSLESTNARNLIEEIRKGGFADSYLDHLGFDRVESLDFSAYEGCSLVHDLNQPIPEEWHQYADVVFDGGTLEHVFHFPNAIASAMNLVKKDGLFLSCCPSNNYNGHGFYQFSPELMFRLFDKPNGYQVEFLALSEAEPGGRIYSVADPAEVGKRVNFSGRGPLQVILIARRKEIVPILRETPQQSDYSARWQSTEDADDSRGSGAQSSLPQRAKSWLRAKLPETFLERYDFRRATTRHRREAMNGITQVASIEDGWKA